MRDIGVIGVNELVKIKTEKNWINHVLKLLKEDEDMFLRDSKMLQGELFYLKPNHWFWKRWYSTHILFLKLKIHNADSNYNFSRMLQRRIRNSCMKGKHEFKIRHSLTGYNIDYKTGAQHPLGYSETKVCQTCQLPKGIFKKK